MPIINEYINGLNGEITVFAASLNQLRRDCNIGGFLVMEKSKKLGHLPRIRDFHGTREIGCPTYPTLEGQMKRHLCALAREKSLGDYKGNSNEDNLFNLRRANQNVEAKGEKLIHSSTLS